MRQARPMTPERALDKLSALCAQSEHCSKEMDDKMRKWGMGESDRQKVLQKLTDEGFIDDNRFAEAFVDDKMRFNQWGRRKIEMALALKGITGQTASEALDRVREEDYINVLHPLLKQKYGSITGKSDYEKIMKLIRFAAGRGFSIDQIKKCIDTYHDITSADD